MHLTIIDGSKIKYVSESNFPGLHEMKQNHK